MILGALIDLGADYAGLRAALARVARGRFELRRRRVVSSSLAATKIDVKITGRDERERSYPEIARVVGRAGLPAPVKDLALEIFRRLCEAEAAVHGVAFSRVHLHEAGALDAIADICGAAWLLEDLAPDRIVCSPLNVGSGTILCRHGTYPVPGPATIHLLEGVPMYAEGSPGERVTPTGAAILSTVVSEFRTLPSLLPIAVGHGAGDHVFPDRPNVLRAILGEEIHDERFLLPDSLTVSKPLPGSGQIVVVETTIDDMNPQNYGFLLDRALAAGALEIFFTPILMKKERPGVKVTALVTPDRFEDLARLIFRETSTIGFRYRIESRRELDREIVHVKTLHGRVRLKVSSDHGEVLQVQPEFEDCRRIAQSRNVPLKEVQRAALAAWKPAKRKAPAAARRRAVAASRHGDAPAGARVPTARRRRTSSPRPSRRRGPRTR